MTQRRDAPSWLAILGWTSLTALLSYLAFLSTLALAGALATLRFAPQDGAGIASLGLVGACSAPLWVFALRSAQAAYRAARGERPWPSAEAPEQASRPTTAGGPEPRGGRLLAPAGLRLALAIGTTLLVAFGVSVLPALRRYRGVFDRQDRGQNLGDLGALRSALDLYRGDHGAYPVNLLSLAQDKRYLPELPALRTPKHGSASAVEYYLSLPAGDTGRWGYVNDPSAADFGKVWIDCAHTDVRGTVWSSY